MLEATCLLKGIKNMQKTLTIANRQACRSRESWTAMSSQSIRGSHRDSQMQTRAASNSVAAANPFVLGATSRDFKKVEAIRSDFNKSLPIEITKTPDPNWKYGKGVNDISRQSLRHVEIDPYGLGQQMISNYKLLISGIPRPISLVSTVSKEGRRNLAPFSYFQVVDHDPPILVIGFSGRPSRPKDTRANLVETGECTISLVSEHMIEAVNGTSLDVPHGISEWELSGLQPAPSSTVKPERVKDAIFTIEGKLLEMKELGYGTHDPGTPSGALAIIQGTRFWVREDAVNEKQDTINLSAMKPLVQLGGISYGRVRETFELPRPSLKAELENESRGLKRNLNQ